MLELDQISIQVDVVIDSLGSLGLALAASDAKDSHAIDVFLTHLRHERSEDHLELIACDDQRRVLSLFATIALMDLMLNLIDVLVASIEKSGASL